MEAAKETNYGDEDDAQTSITPIVQRKGSIPHSTMKNNRIECCNTTRQGVPHTDKRALALRTSLASRYLFTRVVIRTRNYWVSLVIRGLSDGEHVGTYS